MGNDRVGEVDGYGGLACAMIMHRPKKMESEVSRECSIEAVSIEPCTTEAPILTVSKQPYEEHQA